MYVVVPLDVAVVRLTLVVVVTLGAGRQLGRTQSVDVGRLLTDDAGTALSVAMTRLTVDDTRHAHTRLHHTYTWLAVWLSGNALASINVVALRQTRLVPRWVTVYKRVNHFGM